MENRKTPKIPKKYRIVGQEIEEEWCKDKLEQCLSISLTKDQIHVKHLSKLNKSLKIKVNQLSLQIQISIQMQIRVVKWVH